MVNFSKLFLVVLGIVSFTPISMASENGTDTKQTSDNGTDTKQKSDGGQQPDECPLDLDSETDDHD